VMVSAFGGTTQGTLTWNPVAGVVSYNIFRGTTSGGEGATPINASPVTTASYTDSSVVNGTTYYYTVQAVFTTAKSLVSSEVNCTPLAAIPDPAFTIKAGKSQLTLSWVAGAGDLTYNIFRGTTPGGEGATPINSTPLSTLTFTDTNVTSGVAYFYYIIAYNNNGKSKASVEITGIPL